MSRLAFDALDIAALIPTLALAVGALLLAWYALTTLIRFVPHRHQLARQSLAAADGELIDADEYAFSLLGLPVFLSLGGVLLWLVWALLHNLR